MKRFTDSERAEMRRLYEEELQSSVKIGARFNVAPSSVTYSLLTMGVKMRKCGPIKGSKRAPTRQPAAKPERNAEIAARRAAGEKLDALGEAFGISRQRVQKITRRQKEAAQASESSRR